MTWKTGMPVQSLNVFWRQNQGTGKAAKAPPRGLLPSGLHLQSQGRDSSPTWKPEYQARWQLLLLGSPTDISSEHCHPPPAPVPASPPKAEPASPSSCSPQGPATHPLRVTRHWRSPSFPEPSTTVSMGVWSVTVKGLRFRTRRSFRGCGLLAGSSGGSSVKYMTESLTMPSCLCLAFSGMGKQDDEPQETPLRSPFPHPIPPQPTATRDFPPQQPRIPQRRGAEGRLYMLNEELQPNICETGVSLSLSS